RPRAAAAVDVRLVWRPLLAGGVGMEDSGTGSTELDGGDHPSCRSTQPDGRDTGHILSRPAPGAEAALDTAPGRGRLESVRHARFRLAHAERMSADPLRVLIIEDVPMDAELVEYEHGRARIPFEARRVDTRERFLAELDAFGPDVILSDDTLPRFDGMAALELARSHAPATPFLI